MSRNVSFLFVAYLSKRVQKYNFFFISQVLLKVFLRKITFVLLTQYIQELVPFSAPN